MAILVSQATQDTTYLLGTSDAKDTFFGSSQAETLRYSGTGHLEWMDVTTGDRLHLNDASTGWQAQVEGGVAEGSNRPPGQWNPAVLAMDLGVTYTGPPLKEWLAIPCPR